MHRHHGLANPAEDELVRQVRLGLRRTYGTTPTRLARPLTVPEISQIIETIDRSSPIGTRDAEIILLGYASAMRGAELVALTLADIETKSGGLLVRIRHSETDRGEGQFVAVDHGNHAATDSSHQSTPGSSAVATTPVRSSPASGPAASASTHSDTRTSPSSSTATSGRWRRSPRRRARRAAP